VTRTRARGLLVPIVAGCFLLAGYLLNQTWARNERRAKAFAEALAAVEDYLEMPYRVRRRPASEPETRAMLTNQMSDIKARIAFHQAWLQVEAPQVAAAFDDLVRAAQEEGGAQMQQAWQEPLRDTDAAMNLGVAYNRSKSDSARSKTLERMREEISFPRGPRTPRLGSGGRRGHRAASDQAEAATGQGENACV
jgi:hypothetical protein